MGLEVEAAVDPAKYFRDVIVSGAVFIDAVRMTMVGSAKNGEAGGLWTMSVWMDK